MSDAVLRALQKAALMGDYEAAMRFVVEYSASHSVSEMSPEEPPTVPCNTCIPNHPWPTNPYKVGQKIEVWEDLNDKYGGKDYERHNLNLQSLKPATIMATISRPHDEWRVDARLDNEKCQACGEGRRIIRHLMNDFVRPQDKTENINGRSFLGFGNDARRIG